MIRRAIARGDLRLRRRLPFLKTTGGRATFALLAVVGVLSTVLNLVDPGPADGSQVAAVTGLFFVVVLGGIAGADALFAAWRSSRH